MKFSHYLYLVKSDLFRYAGNVSWSVFLKVLNTMPGFKVTFWIRTCKYISLLRHVRFFLLPLVIRILNNLTFKYGISIPYATEIGPGFYIGHFGGIVINRECTIGKNCNISHGVTLGQTNRGTKKGSPVIGNGVYVAPGAKIIGKIYIGNNVAIGANSVVTKDIPDNSVVVGIPGRVISLNGATDYINRINYDY